MNWVQISEAAWLNLDQMTYMYQDQDLGMLHMYRDQDLGMLHMYSCYTGAEGYVATGEYAAKILARMEGER